MKKVFDQFFMHFKNLTLLILLRFYEVLKITSNWLNYFEDNFFLCFKNFEHFFAIYKHGKLKIVRL